MNFQIVPFSGLVPIEFGMTPEEVTLLPEMGVPESAHVDTYGTHIEFRSLGRPICNYVDGKLISVMVDNHVKNVLFEEMDVFTEESRKLLLALQKANGGAEIGLGFVMFWKIGISTQGFYDENTASFFDPSISEEPRIVEVFTPGKYDAIASEFRPIDLTQ